MPSGGLYNPLFFSLKTFTTGHRQPSVCRTLFRRNQLGNGNKEKNWMNSVHRVWPRPGPLTNLRNTDSARPRIGKGPRAKARLVRNSIRNRSRGPFLAQAPRRVPFSFSLSSLHAPGRTNSSELRHCKIFHSKKRKTHITNITSMQISTLFSTAYIYIFRNEYSREC